MKYYNVRITFRFLNPHYFFALLVIAGIAPGSQGDIAGKSSLPLNFLVLKCAVNARVNSIQQIIFHESHICLCLRVTEAGIKLKNFWAFRGQHYAGVETPDKFSSLGSHTFYSRRDYFSFNFSHQRIIYERQRRNYPHAASIRPDIAIKNSYMVLRSWKNFIIFTVGKRMNRNFYAF